MFDEYERAALEYQSLIDKISEADFVRVADAETSDENCRSIRTVTAHVIMAGYAYANYLRERFSIIAKPARLESITRQNAAARFVAMLGYTERTLAGRWEMSDDEIAATIVKTRWGGTYDLEQLLEHAVVHVLRHRRQIEKFLLKFEEEGREAAETV